MNIGIAFILVIAVGMMILSGLYASAYVIREFILETKNKRKSDRQPDCTVTETGVGVIEPWETTHERQAWNELIRVFDFEGGRRLKEDDNETRT